MNLLQWLRCAFLLPILLSATVVPACARQKDDASKIVVENDVEYANPDNQHLMVDMARPAEGKGLFPAILCIHGGGFRGGRPARL